MTEPGARDLEDIQGLVYSPWTNHGYAGFVFARFGDARASRAWLEAQRRLVTPVVRRGHKQPGRLQIALSASGLAALEVPPHVIGMLPAEATAGMAARERALSDTDSAAWRLGGPGDRLDVLVMIYSCDGDARARLVDEQREKLAAAGAEVRPDELGWPMGKREHFGFADGLSQPYLPGVHAEPRRGEDRIAAGEILLGYPNAYDQLPLSPIWDGFDLGKNGTFLVFRKLEQNVAGFWGWIADRARSLSGGDAAAAAQLTELIGAKLVGRWRNGAPLVLAPDQEDPDYAAPDRINAFGYYFHDPDGMRCPITAHIRRANPRDARGGSPSDSKTVVNRHRIIRRGRSYGAPLPDDAARAGRDDGVERGLYFLCLQSSIARGFEFIQQTWLTNPGFLGLHGEPDPLIGGRGGASHITIPAEPVRLRLANVPTVVTNRGGGYFFLPSLSALARIATGP